MREYIRLQSTSHVVGVLIAAGGVDLAAVVLLIQDVLGVLLGLVGGVWVCWRVRRKGGGRRWGNEGRGGTYLGY